MYTKLQNYGYSVFTCTYILIQYYSIYCCFTVENNASPGPAYNVDSTFTARGRAVAPSFSFGGRVKTPSKLYNIQLLPSYEVNIQ